MRFKPPLILTCSFVYVLWRCSKISIFLRSKSPPICVAFRFSKYNGIPFSSTNFSGSNSLRAFGLADFFSSARISWKQGKSKALLIKSLPDPTSQKPRSRRLPPWSCPTKPVDLEAGVHEEEWRCWSCSPSLCLRCEARREREKLSRSEKKMN